MKKILLAAILTITISTFFTTLYAQQDEWCQGRTKGIYSIGFGGTQGIGVGGDGYYGYGGGYGYGFGERASSLTTLGITINASGEYKIWNFIGLGWQSGINIYPFAGGGAGIEIPFQAKANVHILDAANVSIANKLDVYAGLGVGAGPAFFTYPGYSGTSVYGVVHVGPQVGVRYWFNSKIAIFGEFGWGTSFANAGVTL